MTATTTLYRDVAGSAAWDALPRVIHDLHERGGDGTLTVTSRGFAAVLSFLGFAPSAGSAPVVLRVEKTSEGERWVRSFRDEVFASEQRLVRGLISERFGIFEWTFKVAARADSLRYEVLNVYLRFGKVRLTVPPWMIPRFDVSERADGHRVSVNVAAGKSFRYAGYLTPRV